MYIYIYISGDKYGSMINSGSVSNLCAPRSSPAPKNLSAAYFKLKIIESLIFAKGSTISKILKLLGNPQEAIEPENLSHTKTKYSYYNIQEFSEIIDFLISKN